MNLPSESKEVVFGNVLRYFETKCRLIREFKKVKLNLRNHLMKLKSLLMEESFPGQNDIFSWGGSSGLSGLGL